MLSDTGHSPVVSIATFAHLSVLEYRCNGIPATQAIFVKVLDKKQF